MFVAIVALAWTGIVIYSAARHWGGHVPAPPDLSSFGAGVISSNRARQVEAAFAWTSLTNLQPAVNLNDPFFPTPGQPAPAPPAAPAPSTRKVDLLYQGYYSTSQGEKRAYVLVGDQLLVGPIGTKVLANLVISDISLRTLTLKDDVGKEIRLNFDAKTTLEIPL
ncbi:MAG: hypothetical protein M1608_03385 [Candidatus Omnitrophica bacterium]|nr:hypothetical protein [Candidatus Omnitrophota bacterium]